MRTALGMALDTTFQASASGYMKLSVLHWHFGSVCTEALGGELFPTSGRTSAQVPEGFDLLQLALESWDGIGSQRCGDTFPEFLCGEDCPFQRVFWGEVSKLKLQGWTENDQGS